MSITPLQLTGVSTMSSSLQQVLTRAVNIASIPLSQLQNNDTDTLQKQTLLSSFSSAALTLGSAVTGLGGVGSGGAMSATSSDSSLVTVQNNGSTSAMVHTISNITSVASQASGTSSPFADVNQTPVSTSGKMRVIVDDKTYDITLASNTLTGLQNAINGLGAGVTASIIKAGATSNYLSVTADSTGQIKSLQIEDNPPITLTTATLGSDPAAASGTTSTFATADSTPVSTSPTKSMQLTVGSQTYAITLADNSLNGLAGAINGLGAGVTASVSSSGPPYSLSVTANETGAVSKLQLTDDPGGANTVMFATRNLGSDPAAASAVTGTFADTTQAHVSGTGTMQLNVGSNTYAIQLDDSTNNLTGLMAAINSAGAGVTASLGSSNNLTITSDSTGSISKLELLDIPSGTSQLLKTVQLGTDAVFQVDGLDVDSKTNSVTDVVPGMSFNILGTTTGTTKVTLSLATDSSQLASSISSFVSAYNAMQTQLDQQVGSNAGLLTGDGVVRDLQGDMRALAGFTTSSGSIKSLADIGLTFDESGVLSFDTKVFNSLSDSQIQDAMSFFGSTTGFGSLASKFTTLTDPVTGSIKVEQDGLTASDKNLQSQISTLQDRINTMQTDLLTRLQAADVLIAGLETQEQILTGAIQASTLTTFGYTNKT